MGRIEFENYGRRATSGVDETELSGRYKSQSFAEKNIVPEVLQKLEIQPEDRLLEIGCGPGQLAIPLSFMVDTLTGIDHLEVCKVFEHRFKSPNIRLIPGNFLEVDLSGEKYNKILCYSVITTLAKSELLNFIDKALDHLEPGGKMLIGDIANVDKKTRFQNTPYGQEFEKAWQEKKLSSVSLSVASLDLDLDKCDLTDEGLVRTMLYIRKKGFHCYVIPQRADLPWGHTREDLLVVSPF